MKIVPEMMANGKKVIDLSGDFRLKDPKLYEQYYKEIHLASSELSSATYGLPEINRDAISVSQLVSNPGCYPTSAIIPLAPLLKNDLVEPDDISISSLSGVSGAGRKASVDLSFAEVDGSVVLRPHRVAGKAGEIRHLGERQVHLGAAAGVVEVAH